MQGLSQSYSEACARTAGGDKSRGSGGMGNDLAKVVTGDLYSRVASRVLDTDYLQTVWVTVPISLKQQFEENYTR